MEIHQILAPTDFSACSKQAVAYAYELARTFGAKLLLLHIVELPAYATEVFLPSEDGTTLLDDLERQARLDLAQLLPEAQDGTVEVTFQAGLGTPYRPPPSGNGERGRAGGAHGPLSCVDHPADGRGSLARACSCTAREPRNRLKCHAHM
jgi:hypothetical protein